MKHSHLFYLSIAILLLIIALSYQHTASVAWLCLAVAAYSAIGNDSIQTLGTFLSSNRKVSRLKIFSFIAGVFLLTMTYGYFFENDLAFGRLTKIPEVTQFSIWQASVPVVLVLLTRFKIPVSTTFLLLALFANNETIEAMLRKSFLGYGLAFAIGLMIFGFFYFLPYFRRQLSDKEQRYWRISQWLTTAFLWSSWLMQDTANILVFIPRQHSFISFIAVCLLVVAMIAIIIFMRGGPIQKLVTEKKDVTDVRAATLIDLTMAFILIYFKQLSALPMSTTWVFLGLLAGRETILTLLASINNDEKLPMYKATLKLVLKDIMLATLGILISLLLVYCAQVSK